MNSVRIYILPYSENQKKVPNTALFLKTDSDGDLSSDTAMSLTKMAMADSRGKAVLLQAWSGPEGSRKLRFSDFMTTAQDGGKIFSLTHRPPLPPGNTPGTHFC